MQPCIDQSLLSSSWHDIIISGFKVNISSMNKDYLSRNIYTRIYIYIYIYIYLWIRIGFFFLSFFLFFFFFFLWFRIVQHHVELNRRDMIHQQTVVAKKVWLKNQIWKQTKISHQLYKQPRGRKIRINVDTIAGQNWINQSLYKATKE